MDPGYPAGATARPVDTYGFLEEVSIFSGTGRGTPLSPRIVAAGGDTQNPTQHDHCMIGLLAFYERKCCRLKTLTSTPLTLTYNYSSAGNVSSIVDGSGGTPVNLNYGYDGANRLTSAQVNLPGGLQTVTYQYDGAGNRLMETWTDARGAIQYQYLSGNYLQSRGGAAGTQYAWGSYGQLESKQEGSALTDYVYDPRRLMTQVTVNGGEVARFFYEALGRRVKAVEGGTTTVTIFSGNDIVYEVKSSASAPATTTRYLALNGKYLGKTVQDGANRPQTFFYHMGLVGSVRALTDASGQVVANLGTSRLG